MSCNISLAPTQQITHHCLQWILSLDGAPTKILQANLVHLFIEAWIACERRFIVLVGHLIDHIELTQVHSFDEELYETENGWWGAIRPLHVLKVLPDGSRFGRISASLQHVEASSRHEEILLTLIACLHYMFHALDHFLFVPSLEVELVGTRVKSLLFETVTKEPCDLWSWVLREINDSLDNTLGTNQLAMLDGILCDLDQEVVCRLI